jgi:hypothetical protein
MAKRRRRLSKCAMVGVAAASGIGVAAAPARATASCHTVDPHVVVRSTACNLPFVDHKLTVTNWKYVTIHDDDSEQLLRHAYLQHVLRAFGQGCGISGGENDFVDVGYGKNVGVDYDYSVFTEWVQDGDYSFSRIDAANNDGTSHSFQISVHYVPALDAYEWNPSIDGQVYGYFDGGIGNAICQDTVGLEYSTATGDSLFNDAGLSASTFHATPLKWQDEGGTWHTGFNAGGVWIEHGCGSGYSPPNCFNGVFSGSGNNDWATNKPAS